MEHKALEDVSLEITDGSYTAVIGHTGSGKSTLMQHLNGLLKPTEGFLEINGHQITPETQNKELGDLRKEVGFVFQFPEAQLFEETVKKDIAFAPKNFGKADEEAEAIAVRMAKMVDLPDEILDKSPFELSGGMNQRVGIALAMVNNPQIILADEPTSALDVTVQMKVLKEMHDLREEFKTSIVLVTHSIGVVAQLCDTVGVMYAGRMVEWGTTEELLSRPYHPYTKALIDAVPTEMGSDPVGINGMPPDFGAQISGCPFAPRCPYASEECEKAMPGQSYFGERRWVRCIHPLKSGGVR